LPDVVAFLPFGILNDYILSFGNRISHRKRGKIYYDGEMILTILMKEYFIERRGNEDEITVQVSPDIGRNYVGFFNWMLQ
jgi:hypothetical protein